MKDLNVSFESFRYWLGDVWTTRPLLGLAMVFGVVSIPIVWAWLGRMRRRAEARRVLREDD